jgi:hypothetical protein
MGDNDLLITKYNTKKIPNKLREKNLLPGEQEPGKE